MLRHGRGGDREHQLSGPITDSGAWATNALHRHNRVGPSGGDESRPRATSSVRPSALVARDGALSSYPSGLVEVRCRRCGADVSEWAARCPECGAGLDDAAPAHGAIPPGRYRRRRGGRWRLGLALLVAAVAVAAVLTLRQSGGGHATLTGVPAELRDRLLFFAGPGEGKVVRADGTVVQSLPQVGSVSYPIKPVVTAEHLVVFALDGQAYRVGADAPGPAVRVGAADRVFPADGGDVGLQVGRDPSEPSFVEYMAADGTVPQYGTTSTPLPAGSTAVARMPTGLLVLTSHNRLAFLAGETSVSLGPVRSVIGSFNVTVAWDAAKRS